MASDPDACPHCGWKSEYERFKATLYDLGFMVRHNYASDGIEVRRHVRDCIWFIYEITGMEFCASRGDLDVLVESVQKEWKEQIVVW